MKTSLETQPLNTAYDNIEYKHSTDLFGTFVLTSDDIKQKMIEVEGYVLKIELYQQHVYNDTLRLIPTSPKNRASLKKYREKAIHKLKYIYQQITKIEPSKPYLSELDVRNMEYKQMLKKYKDLLDRIISTTLSNQRNILGVFKRLIKQVNPQATSFDLERATAFSSEGSPSAFVQVLLQRGIQGNNKDVRRLLDMVQHIHVDSIEASETFSILSELRSEANIMIERYRSRWPAIIKEGETIYVIDDHLNLLEETSVGADIDFEMLLKRREKRLKLRTGFIALSIGLTITATIVLTVFFSQILI
ncbi:hypothetical protein BDB01DRAFT_785497 [Pilobolus umbonatus]|nr:hypothetical protein BDB01DRAFT_785497 [Pilobolus umbonatus]